MTNNNFPLQIPLFVEHFLETFAVTPGTSILLTNNPMITEPHVIKIFDWCIAFSHIHTGHKKIDTWAHE